MRVLSTMAALSCLLLVLPSASAFTPTHLPSFLPSRASHLSSLACSNPHNLCPPSQFAARSAGLSLTSSPRSRASPLTVQMLNPALMAKSAVLGGALAGGLHAVSGPDHFPALLPRCVGKRWLAAGKIGALWGLGHALSAMAMGLMAFLVKGKAFTSGRFVSRIAFGADIAIGLSLVLIGFLSIYEAKDIDFSAQMVEARSVEKQTLAMKANLLINGLFHGLALDGIPTLMPVLGLGSLNAAISFLAAYGAGVIVAMVGATVLIGQGTMSLSKTNSFDLGKIVHGSAYAAIVIGALWTGRALGWF